MSLDVPLLYRFRCHLGKGAARPSRPERCLRHPGFAARRSDRQPLLDESERHREPVGDPLGQGMFEVDLRFGDLDGVELQMPFGPTAGTFDDSGGRMGERDARVDQHPPAVRVAGRRESGGEAHGTAGAVGPVWP